MSPEITRLDSVNEAADLIKASMLDLLLLPSSRVLRLIDKSSYAIVQLPCRKGPGTHWAPSATLLFAAATCSLPFAFSER